MQLSTVGVMKTIDSPSMVHVDDESLRKIQDVLLLILDDVVEFCQKNGIEYVLSGGSCLGAVRHQGFIPWDDDMDIDMPRESYERFLELFPKAFGEKYFISSPELTPYVGIGTARVRLRGTVMRMHDDQGLHEDDCDGIFIDIFPIENVPDNVALRHLHGFACLATGLMYSCRRFWRDRAFYLSFAGDNRSFARSVRVKAALGLPLAVASMERWSTFTVKVYSLCKNAASTFVAVPFGRGHYYGELHPRKVFAESRDASFEGRTVKIPLDAEAYLAKQYGDWQRIPSVEEREHHAYLALDFGVFA